MKNVAYFCYNEVIFIYFFNAFLDKLLWFASHI